MADDLQKYLLEPELAGPEKGSADLTMHRILNQKLEQTLGGLARRTRPELSEQEFKSRLLAGIQSAGPLTADDERFFARMEGGQLSILRKPPVLFAAAAGLLLVFGYSAFLTMQEERSTEMAGVTLEQDSLGTPAHPVPTIPAPAAPTLPAPPAASARKAVAAEAARAESRKESAARAEVALAETAKAADSVAPEKPGVANVAPEKPAADAPEPAAEEMVAMRSRAMPSADAPQKKSIDGDAAREKRLLDAYRKATDPAQKASLRKALEDHYRRSGQDAKIKNL